MDARRAPERVRLRHRANRRADGERHGGRTGTAASLPRPEQEEATAVPSDDRLLWIDDGERRSLLGLNAKHPDPKPPTRLRETDAKALFVAAPAVGVATEHLEPRDRTAHCSVAALLRVWAESAGHIPYVPEHLCSTD